MREIVGIFYNRLKFYIIEMVYMVITFYYLAKLKLLNEKLLKLDGYVEVLKYDEGITFKYFIGALILVLFAGLIIVYRLKHGKIYIHDTVDTVIYFGSIILTLFILWLIIKYISVPIFQAILSGILASCLVWGSKS